jgi:integrase
LVYTINKGNRPMSTLIHPKLQAIIADYIHNDTDTIFGRFNLEDLKKNKRSVIGSENAYINKGLKDLALMIGIKGFSFHQARHSFAFHLKRVSNNIHVIKDSLGHAKTSTTEVYLQSLDDEFLDNEVSKLYLKKPVK